MATQSLYRRYRPRRFGEVKGQEHVVRALREAVADDRVGQAYLFSGPRGTGKTTTARILAKALNCPQVDGGEPCGECESCLSVERGTSYDVHELDAASNNGVEAIRDLIEKASLGTPGRHKVYILDEVHMLSRPAEAALLKTLEEPPSHVVFVLATTDPQKMSDTIRSRTQHLQFHLLPTDTLTEHVRWVADDAGLDLSQEALDAAIAQGGGSARDTLSALELIAATGGEVAEGVALDDFLRALAEHDTGLALTTMAHAVTVGRDPRTVTEDLVRHLRNAFLALLAPELVVLPAEQLAAVRELGEQIGTPALVRAIERLGTTLVDLRNAPDPRVLVEVVLVQLTSESAAGDLDGLAARVDRLQEQVRALTAGGTAPAAGTAGATGIAAARAVLGGEARRQSATEQSPDETTAARAVSGGDARQQATEPAPEPTSAAGSQPTGAATARAMLGGEARRQTATEQSPDEAPAARAVSGGDARQQATESEPEPTSAAGSQPTGAATDRAMLGGEARRQSATEQSPEQGPAPASGATGGATARAVLGGEARRQPAPDGAEPGGAGRRGDTAATPEPPAPAAAAGGGGSFTSVQAAWDGAVKAGLKPLVRALYLAGSFGAETRTDDGVSVRFEVPNAAHGAKVEAHRPVVEQALSAALGMPVTLDIVAAGGAGEAAPSRPAPAAASEPAPTPGAGAERAKAAAAAEPSDPEMAAPEPDFEPEDQIDLSALTDAPPETVKGPLDQLAEAFPGSELLPDDDR